MRRTLGAISGVIGHLLLIFGVIVVLFVAYQLWGTNLKESHSQDVLRQRFNALLAHAHDHSSTTTTTPTTTPTTTSTTPTTTPSSTTTTTNAPTVAPAAASPSEGSPVGEIKIAKIGLDKVIIQGTNTDDLQQGPGHFPGTPLPGEAGNVAIAGHRTTYGAPFFDLNELVKGDPIVITTLQGTFTYDVVNSTVVSPSNTSVVLPTPMPTLTLTTCNPRFSASTRLIVQAQLAIAVLSGAPVPAPAPVVPPASTGTTPTHRSHAAKVAAGLAEARGTIGAALWWGLAVLIASLGGWFLATRQSRRRNKWIVYGVSSAGALVLLFFFFGAISPLLPASF